MILENEGMTRTLPAAALRGTVILPGMIVHVDMSRKRSVSAVDTAMMGDREIFLVAQHDPKIEDPEAEDLYYMGTVCRIKQVMRLPKNVLRVLVEGLTRAETLRISKDGDGMEAEVSVPDMSEDFPDSLRTAMLRNIKGLFADYNRENDKASRDAADQIMMSDDLMYVLDQISLQISLPYEKRQVLLEAATVSDYYEALGMILMAETEIMNLRREISRKVKERVDKNQRDYILREQLKVIREELGEDTTVNDIEKFKRSVKSLRAKKEIKDKILEEIRRLENLPGMSPESAVLRGYIETLLALPWDKVTRDRADLAAAREILDRDHYGLRKVKERILEFLAVRQLTGKGAGPILCLVGPPGTGKTSICRSIAEALGKKYIRLSLGGVRDEAEIRGHRRTYVGAMPGRIAAGLKKAGVKNPLIVLDEIDKVSRDYKGDTASALLEVLDSEQNSHFEDHYVELPLDLSEVLFVTTANDLAPIPGPLRDRMEIIEISSYTENEKQHIAAEHLIPKQIKANGLKKDQLTIADEALSLVISGYTREAGVRQLERRIGEICRKAARRVLENKEKKITVTKENLQDFLGHEKYTVNPVNECDEVGIVRGLAWTSVGGVTLEVEVNTMPGKGTFLLTGQLGDVMKESAQAGISYLRAAAKEHGIPEEFFQKNDIHIHIPEGAVPKDGPSAGVTMATAMYSAATGKKVRADVAMTGEITLRGRVLPIGGLKEKLLAAKNAGIRKVLIPEKNRNDMEEISSEITDGLAIVYVSTMEEVLKEALA
ncbi:MAG: endopeptidase La [Lachnospiraceae bacterium]|nr:endopeptidase La [Lachnospiraceae bacterium]